MKRQFIWKQENKKWKYLFLVSLIFLASNIISCNSKTENKSQSTSEKPKSTGSLEIQNDSLEKVVNAIIDISANDFYKNQKPLPLDFRNVTIKYYLKPTKEMLYILCGQFQTEDNTKWIQFATIKNSNYEQWIGTNGSTYCENSTEISYIKSDLSTALKNRLKSLQSLKK
jgi:hypothetical protein